MADYQAISQRIEVLLAERQKKIINRNAIQALFGAFGNQFNALGQILLGRSDAMDAEKQRIQVDIVIEMLCQIDEAISIAQRSSVFNGVTIAGLIQVTGKYGDTSTTGVDIQGSRPVYFQPNTRVEVTGAGMGPTTGVKIGNASETLNPVSPTSSTEVSPGSLSVSANITCPNCRALLYGLRSGPPEWNICHICGHRFYA